MDGDFSRLLHNNSGSYTGVLMQQGRALVDAEWNEQCALHNDQLRQTVVDLLNELKVMGSSLTGLKLKSSPPVISADENRFQVDVDEGVFYVEGARCQTSKRRVSFARHPQDFNRELTFTISVHAWERTVSSAETQALEDEALDGADSALRTQLVWDLQVDFGVVGEKEYSAWIRSQRGGIMTQHAPLSDSLSNSRPSLYRIEIIQDGIARVPGALTDANIARFAWSAENPTVHKAPDAGEPLPWSELAPQLKQPIIELLTLEQLESGKPGEFKARDEVARNPPAADVKFYRTWDGTQVVRTLPAGRYLELSADEPVKVLFEASRKYRAGEAWLIPYRGEKLADDRFSPPSGRHYYSRIYEQIFGYTATSPPKADHQEFYRLVDNFVGSIDSLRRSLPAKALADETDDVWLRKWLSTALFSEVAQGDFEQFWRRLNRSRASDSGDDGRLLNEAKRIWMKSQKLNLALHEASMTNRLKTVI